MCKVALCFFCFFESTAGLLKTTVRSYVILLTIQLLKVFAHINEQILQIAVAGSCMCVCVCVLIWIKRNTKQFKYQKWALSDVMHGWQLVHTSFQIYSVHAVSRFFFFFFRKIRNVYYCLESPSATCGIYQETVSQQSMELLVLLCYCISSQNIAMLFEPSGRAGT